MSDEMSPGTGGLNASYKHYKRQKCFIGLSQDAYWRPEIKSACQGVFPLFDLEPWYADEYLDPSQTSLLNTVVEMITNARYGIYDLSYWRKDRKSEWIMPRNVLIELGIAIALNRPILLLHHEESQKEGPKLPECLEGIREQIISFTGDRTLEKRLMHHLPLLINTPLDQEWNNRHCHFGNRSCAYREKHPLLRHWIEGPLPCYIADGEDLDQIDFRSTIDDVLINYNDIQFSYLDKLSFTDGYEFMLCTNCQTVRSNPFAIYRISPETPEEAYIAIGISIALEAQSNPKIPKILLASTMDDVPSLLSGYKVVIAKNNVERKARLQEFLPQVYQKVRETTWKIDPLPFKEVMPRYAPEAPIDHVSQQDVLEEVSTDSELESAYDINQNHGKAQKEAYEQINDISPALTYNNSSSNNSRTIKVFVVGRPGSGKSTAIRHIMKFAMGKYVTTHIGDYTILLHMSKQDEHRAKFRSNEYEGLDVTDFSVLDIALDQLASQINYLTNSQDYDIIFAEFARSDYDVAFQRFDPSLLQNAFVLFIEADLNVCIKRVHDRAMIPYRPDDHFLSEHIMRTYYGKDHWFYMNNLFEQEFGIKAQHLKTIYNDNTLSQLETNSEVFAFSLFQEVQRPQNAYGVDKEEVRGFLSL